MAQRADKTQQATEVQALRRQMQAEFQAREEQMQAELQGREEQMKAELQARDDQMHEQWTRKQAQIEEMVRQLDLRRTHEIPAAPAAASNYNIGAANRNPKTGMSGATKISTHATNELLMRQMRRAKSLYA